MHRAAAVHKENPMGDGGSLILLGGATYSRVEAGECERREKILFGYIGSFQLLESPGIVEPPSIHPL